MSIIPRAGHRRFVKKNKIAERCIQVALVESDPLRVAGFRALLENYEDLNLRPLSLSDLSCATDVHVVLLGRHSQGFAQTMQHLNTVRPDLRVIVTASGKTDEAVLEALVIGAKGYVDDSAPAAEFVNAIRVVEQGLIWSSRRILALFVERNASKRVAGAMEFTKRESEVLEMLVAGRSNREIADPLGIEVRTVKAHVAKLMRKVGVQNRVALSIHVLNNSLVAPR
jgi:DNA-binding NarL/FixJ family response regulator